MKKQSQNQKNTLPLLDDFLLYLQTNNYSDETIYNYERDLKIFENFIKENNLEFQKLNRRDIETYKAYLNSIDRETPTGKASKQKLKSFSLNRILSSVRSYLHYLIEMEYTTSILPEHIKLVRTEKKHPKIAELKEFVKLIESPSRLEKDSIIAKRNRAMLEVLFSTGMRISELMKLNKTQVDSEGRIFIIGKGKKERFVYLTERALKYLREYLETRKDTLPGMFIPYRGRNVNEKGKNISTNYLQEKIKQYRELLGINIPISAHSLRHGFATYLAEQGANPAAIQILLGHESLATTTRYVHASDKYAQTTHKKFHPLQK